MSKNQASLNSIYIPFYCNQLFRLFETMLDFKDRKNRIKLIGLSYDL